MSRTTGRTMELLGLLHTGRRWSSAQLCMRLGVSERTLRRDVDDLRALGYGIGAIRGAGGGYALQAGASLPPLALTPEEAIAVGLGLRTAAAAGVIGLDEAAERALAKLELSLAPEARERIALLAHSMIHLGGRGDPVPIDTVTTVARAIRESRRLRIDYTRADGRGRRRLVEPQRLVRTTDRWYLIAWEPDRRRWRTLRLDRLRPGLPLGERFTPRDVPHEELARFTSWSIAVAPYPVRTTVRMHAPIDAVRRHFGPESARLTDLGDGTTRVEAGAADAATLRKWLQLPGARWEHLGGTRVPDE